MDSNYNFKITRSKFTQTYYAWAHLSCASFLEDVTYTCRSAVKLTKLKESAFEHTCIICKQNHGACVKCSDPECQIYFHAECARRANYYIDIGRQISSQGQI